MTIDELSKFYDAAESTYLERWQRLLRIPSVSADPAHAADCRACADAVRAQLDDMGFDTRCIETGSLPLVYAIRRGRPGAPTVLVYGHYDVQPADPVDAWSSPPFEPTLRDGRVYARGAQDNKGQLSYVLCALDALAAAGELTCTVKVLVEGEEESGSQGMNGSLDAWKPDAAADVLMAADTEMVDANTPTLTLSLRGVVHLTVTLRGARTDLHSGVHGGVAPNAADGMARLLAGLHDADGRVAVDGFYDGVAEPSETEAAAAEAAGFDPSDYESRTGVPPAGGEAGRFSPRVRAGLRPTLEINGVASGYSGAGMKTIIPATARAKLSARTVPGQAPDHVLACIVSHLERHVPEGLRLTVSEAGAAGGALSTPADSPAIQPAFAALRDIYGRAPVCLREGASIPVLSLLAEASGADPLLVGFGCPEDNIHAPNESFDVAQFRKGFLFTGLFFSELQHAGNA